MSEPATTCRDGILEVARPGTRWLSTGWRGGRTQAPAAFNCTVPEGWDPENVDDYVERRFARAGFEPDGPVLLTGVAQRHARGARAGPVTAFATVGLSNPATLPVEPADDGPPRADRPARSGNPDRPPAGTVNVVVLTSRALTEAGAANLLAVASEARTATLLALTGFTGTTSDAAVIGYDPDGELARYTGSATTVGRAARACVRDAIRASFAARYDDRDPPDSVATAAHGAATTECAEVFEP